MNGAIIRAAKLIQVSNRSEEDTALCHSIMDTLVAAYETMFSGGLRLGTAVDAIIPLHACAKAGYWRRGFAEALLQRLSARGGALLRANTAARKAAWGSPPPAGAGRPLLVEHDQADLWWSLALAPASVRSSVDLRVLLDVSADVLLELEEQDVEACSRILHACARLGLRHERLALHLGARLGLGRAGAAQDGAAVARALQAIGALTAGSSAEEAEVEAEKSVQDESEDGPVGAVSEAAASDVQDGAQIPWATVASVLDSCANLGCADPSIIGPLAAAAVRAAPLMTPRGLATATRSLAELGYAEQGVYAALADAASQPGAMQGARPQDWQDVWYALAMVRHRPPPSRLLTQTAEAAQTLRRGASPQACTNVLWALAVLRLYDERLVAALTVRLVKLLGQSTATVTGSHLCVSLWALAVMGPAALSRHSAAARELLREVARRWEAGDHADFRRENLSQLQQAQAELEAVGDAELHDILGATREDAGQGSLLMAARTATASRQDEEGVTSLMEVAVVGALEELQQRLSPGVIVVVQPLAPIGQGRVADVLVELAGGRRVAVEVDGPWHFLASHPQNPTAVNGPTKLRNRQLERFLGAGNVLSVPWWEWEELKKKKARRGYLCRLLGLEAV